jgi:hypothetical protein
MPFRAGMSATQAIEKLAANDPTLLAADLSRSSVMEKGKECARRQVKRDCASALPCERAPHAEALACDRARTVSRLIPKLAAALAVNTCCLELKLCDNDLVDALVSTLAT